MKTALVTGSASRIGAQIIKTLHQNNYNVIIHYNHSFSGALALSKQLNQLRKNSASIVKAELTNINVIKKLTKTIDSLDLLVNNAAVFYPTPFMQSKQDTWEQIINTNLRAPFFLSQTFTQQLANNNGCIINIIDIHSLRPLKNYSIYNISKAALIMLTKTLAKELAPDIRVCAISPGLILYPKNTEQTNKNNILNKIPLAKKGSIKDIADAVLFLARSTYITGQVITIDGGRTLNQ